MISKKIGKLEFSLLKGRISKNSYEESIKKLSLASQNGFVQILPTRLIAGQNHLLSAIENTFSSFKNKSNFSKKPELELIIRLTGIKQLNKALRKAEFGKEDLVLIIDSKNKGKIDSIKKELGFAEKNFELGKNKKYLMKFFNITKEELNSLADLKNPLEEIIIERCSLVSLER